MAKKFDYNKVKKYIEQYEYVLISKQYINTHKKLEIKCPKGHIFQMSFNNFKKGQRCPICSRENQNRIPKNPNNKKHSQKYIEELVEARGYKLLEPYVNKRTKLKLTCPNGHYHEIRLDSFQNGSGCKQCMKEKMTNDIQYVIKNIEKNGFKLLSKYRRGNEPITLQCEKGHIFESTYDRIVNHGCGCPICLESKGEKVIRKFLMKNNIDFKQEYKFKNCKLHKELPFDFYIPSLNIAIEYDGIQHFEIISHFGGLDGFIERKIRDTIKTIYCKENDIKLIRIPYWDFDNINKILNKELFKHE